MGFVKNERHEVFEYERGETQEGEEDTGALIRAITSWRDLALCFSWRLSSRFQPSLSGHVQVHGLFDLFTPSHPCTFRIALCGHS